MEAIRLSDLADLALGTPVVGTVNFSALHTLLHAIIQHLNIQDVSVVLLEDTRSCPPSRSIVTKEEVDGQEDRMEPRILHIEKQLELLNNIPSRLDIIEKTKAGEQAGGSAMEDMQEMMQLSEKLEVTEEGVCKENLQQPSQEEPKELELLKTRVKTLEDKMEELCETRRPETQEAQTTHSLEPSDNDTSRMSGPTHVAEILVSDGPMLDTSHTLLPQTQGSSKAEDSAHPVETPHVTEDGITASRLTMTGMGTTAEPEFAGVTLALPTGVTTKDYAMLYTRVDALERDKADRTELGLLQKNTDDLQEKLSSLNKEMQDLREDRDKYNALHGILTTAASSLSTFPAMIIPKPSDSYNPVSTGAAVTEIPKQDTMQTKSSLTTTSKDHLTSPAYITDEGKKVSEVVNQYEDLKKVVTDGEAAGKDLQEGKKTTDTYLQDSEVTDYINNPMVQEECEHLNKTSTSLIQNLDEEQQHIDILYQAIGKLEEKKTDKELIGLDIDVKANKRTLESKVSRTHFDATTEHLSRMVQELLGKVNAQEQDWQRLLEKINAEMQNKTDRMEVDSLKNIMEKRWQDLRQKLQEHSSQHGAAGIRKQLMRFQCLSCDRPVDMVVPGSEILTIPKFPGLPAHHSNQPYSVFELNRVREQSRSCGGRHTLTFSQGNYAKLQANSPCSVQKKDTTGAGRKQEVFISGKDSHLYRGKMDNHLPTFKPEESKRVPSTHQRASEYNLKEKENTSGFSSAASSDRCSGVSGFHVKSTNAPEQPLPSIKGSTAPTYFTIENSAHRASELARLPSSASDGPLHQQSD